MGATVQAIAGTSRRKQAELVTGLWDFFSYLHRTTARIVTSSQEVLHKCWAHSKCSGSLIYHNRLHQFH